jgi:hypothetical protein
MSRILSLYDALLRAYPSPFYEKYAPVMLATFAETLAETSLKIGVIAQAFAELPASLVKAHAGHFFTRTSLGDYFWRALNVGILGLLAYIVNLGNSRTNVILTPGFFRIATNLMFLFIAIGSFKACRNAAFALSNAFLAIAGTVFYIGTPVFYSVSRAHFTPFWLAFIFVPAATSYLRMLQASMRREPLRSAWFSHNSSETPPVRSGTFIALYLGLACAAIACKLISWYDGPWYDIHPIIVYAMPVLARAFEAACVTLAMVYAYRRSGLSVAGIVCTIGALTYVGFSSSLSDLLGGGNFIDGYDPNLTILFKDIFKYDFYAQYLQTHSYVVWSIVVGGIPLLIVLACALIAARFPIYTIRVPKLRLLLRVE